MNFCPYCGKELNEGMQFCPFCGKELAPGQFNDSSAAQPQQTATTLQKTKAHSSKKLLIGLIILVIAALAAMFILNPFGGNFTEDPDAIQKAADSVVKLYMYDANGVGVATGSGFAVFDKDIIVTNHHCIEGDVYFVEAQREDGSTFMIESVIAYDEEKDLAVLRAPDCGLTPLKTAVGLNTKKGEKVAAIGSPEGIASMYSTGVISNILDFGTHYELSSTASISHGSSGGALFNSHGKVIAVTSAGHTEGNEIYFNVPIEYAKELYDNRSPETEMTLAEFYEQSEHPYSVDYICANGNLLHNQTVVTGGYISGMDSGIYIVSSPDLILGIDLRNNFDLESSLLLRELRSASYAIEIDTKRNHIYTDDLAPYDLIAVEGTVMFYSSTDIRVIATDLVKIE